MEFGVQNVNANLFSDNKCIETENAWFWEMLNLVSIWHENALFLALLCSVSEDCSETWPGCLNQVSGMSLRHSWNVEDPKPRFSQFWGKSCMQCWIDKCVQKWHWMSDACDSLLVSLSCCISTSQPPKEKVTCCNGSQPSEWPFHWVSHWNFTGCQKAFCAVKFGKIDPKFDLKIQLKRSF